MEVQPNSNKPLDRDSEVWDEINRSLWEIVTINVPEDGVIAEDSISTPDLRKKNCFSFARCAEIAAWPERMTANDSIHLKSCHYCEHRISTFTQHGTEAVESMAEAAISPSQTGYRTGVSELLKLLSGLFSRPLLAGGFAALILFFTVLGILVFRTSPEPANIARTSSVNTEPDGALNTDKAIDTSAADTTGLTLSTPSPSTSVSASPDPPSQIQETPVKRSDVAGSPLDLAGIPQAMHGFVINVRNSAGISAPLLKRFSKGLRQVRAGGVKPLSPVRKAIVENQPTFQWEARPNAVYEISLLDSGKNRIDGAKDLKANSWKSPIPLSPGIYYWDLMAIDGNDIRITKNVIFKVVDGAEVERVKSENKSHLDKASYFIYVGLLDEAAAELQAELRKNPGSRKVRTILKQVKDWQRRLQ